VLTLKLQFFSVMLECYRTLPYCEELTRCLKLQLETEYNTGKRYLAMSFPIGTHVAEGADKGSFPITRGFQMAKLQKLKAG